MASNLHEFMFQTVDYIVLVVILVLSAGVGLYSSTVKNQQTSLSEYFLAGKNVPIFLVVLSYFSSFAAGGMSGHAIETYMFGTQIIISIVFLIPVCALFLHYLVIPVFYQLQNVSMLKYFEIRFGQVVCNMVMAANIFLMTSLASVNLYVAAVSINQVSDLSFWVAAGLMSAICIIYSTMGGIRGIVLADALQAGIMIFATVFIFIMGIAKSGGIQVIWDINAKHSRLEFFNMNFNLKIRHTFWSNLFPYTIMLLSTVATNQTLLQRCLMAPNLKAAQRISTIGSSMTVIYITIFQLLGMVIFAYYKACNVMKTGYMSNVNQLLPFFAMEILHEYPAFPGIFISGILCAALSTISSLLNSISAIIITHSLQSKNISEKIVTAVCKALVVVFGGIMILGLVLIEKFEHFTQAGVTLVSVISGPTFILYCTGIFLPQANRKCVGLAFAAAVLFGLWLTTGIVMISPTTAPFPFANCTNNSVAIDNVMNTTLTIIVSNSTTIAGDNDLYTSRLNQWFPLTKLSYVYICLEGIVVYVAIFTLLSIIFGAEKSEMSEEISAINLNLIPKCIQRIHLKMSKKTRRFLLCDIYDKNQQEGEKLMAIVNQNN